MEADRASVADTPPPQSKLERRLLDELDSIRVLRRYRLRKAVDGPHRVLSKVDGQDKVNFCSNDYLGLAADPRVIAAGQAALAKHGVGSGASALICGYNRAHRELEEALADFAGFPRALLFSSGWAANLGVIRALLTRGDRIIADELNHASLIDGGRLSGADYFRVSHADIGSFAQAIANVPRESAAMLVTDSVFSMDGDLAPLPELSRLCRAQDIPWMVDDAHGFGAFGDNGRGAIEHFQAIDPGMPSPDVYVATLGKSLGCAGAFVAGSEALIEYLIQRARPWIFSTAPPPAIAAAALAALRIVIAEPERRLRLQRNIRRLTEGAQQLGIPVGAPMPNGDLIVSKTAIQPLVVGDEGRALALSRHLYERGYWVAAIRPPTVPRGTSRLRITLSAEHRDQQIDGLLEAIADGLAASGVSSNLTINRSAAAAP